MQKKYKLTHLEHEVLSYLADKQVLDILLGMNMAVCMCTRKNQIKSLIIGTQICVIN